MKIKVHLNNLTIPYEEAFNKAKEFFKYHGEELEFTFVKTNIKKFNLYYNQDVNRWLIKDNYKNLSLGKDVNIFIFDQNYWATPKGSHYPLKPETPCGQQYFIGNSPYAEVGWYKESDWVQIAHELTHARAGLLGCANVLDSYLENENPYSKTGNFSKQWKLIKDKLALKYVFIVREKSDSKQTLGYLEAMNGDMSFSCRTLELPWLKNEKNISCIPKGTYDVVWTFSPKFLKYTYEIVGVPNRTGIRIHSASYYHQLNGCVALGNNVQDLNKDGEKDVINSKITVDAFNSFMGKKSFKITIN